MQLDTTEKATTTTAAAIEAEEATSAVLEAENQSLSLLSLSPSLSLSLSLSLPHLSLLPLDLTGALRKRADFDGNLSPSSSCAKDFELAANFSRKRRLQLTWLLLLLWAAAVLLMFFSLSSLKLQNELNSQSTKAT